MDPERPRTKPAPALSRRALIVGAGVVAAGALGATVAATRPLPATGGASPAAAAAPELRTFVSTAVTAPAVTALKTGTTASGLVCVTQQVKGFNGLIMHEGGEPVWIEPTRANITDLKVQRYRGEPVLTYWTGTSTAGHGAGRCVVLDATYTQIASVSAGAGVQADLHEFTLTDRGTALITAYENVPMDLRSIGGPADGHAYDCRVQEIDVATGAVLLDWRASDHIPVAETYLGLTQDAGHDGKTAARAFDPYHLNAVEDDGDRLLVSARHTHTVYAIDRSTGEVLWRFGGRASDFAVADRAVFAWQHDVRRNADGTVTLFDNHLYAKADGHSRGLRFALDESARTATLLREYAHGDHLGTAMGSVQVLDNGNVLVGWGTDPAVTEFDQDGVAVYEATLGGISYRAARCEWTGRPATAPSVAVRAEGDRVRVHASWNGATEVRRWRVLAGGTGGLQAVATVDSAGFETSVLIPAAERYAVEALDAAGTTLGTSAATTASG